jgi:hypothetical protein
VRLPAYGLDDRGPRPPWLGWALGTSDDSRLRALFGEEDIAFFGTSDSRRRAIHLKTRDVACALWERHVHPDWQGARVWPLPAWAEGAKMRREWDTYEDVDGDVEQVDEIEGWLVELDSAALAAQLGPWESDGGP